MIRGEVTDQLGALVSRASVTVINANGSPRTTQTNQEGQFTVSGLRTGKYSIVVAAQGFARYEDSDVQVAPRQVTTLAIKLAVTVSAQVTVDNQQAINTDPEANASATILRGSDIKALPDDPTELAAALQALAGPAAGPNGGEIFIDGFSGGRLPPRDIIREVRINQNPFSSEYDRLGLGRIEIFTKPGTEKLRGEAGFEFEDESLNSRNPFAPNRPPFQVRTISGNLSGPIRKKVASFFVDIDREHADNNSVINALILDPSLTITPFHLALVRPSKDFEMSPRFDLKLNQNNTLVARYSYSRSETIRGGIGGFELLSRAFNSISSDHTVRFTETAILNATTVNETRFQYIHRRSSQTGANSSPTIRVLDAFTGGGANVALAFSNEDRWELQNFTSFLRGNHSLKAGLRLRHVRLTDSSPGNFAGTFTFTSLEQYRNTILNLAGAFPTQFSIAGGTALADIAQTDLGVFVQDDWRVHPGLTLSFGLRYETQTNISSQLNFSPRFGFAYAPHAGGKSPPKTVFRGGFGTFYDRFGESLSLQARRFNGVNQQQFVVTDPAILDPIVFTASGVSNVPTVQALTAFAQAQTTRVVSPALQAPFTMQTVFSVERQLPYKTTIAATYSNSQTRRLFRSRNINAPINGVRPLPASGNIFQYESTGRFNQNQLIFNWRSNFSERISLFGNFSLGFAKSDSEGAGTFPANSYDLNGEYGRALLDIRKRFVIGGSLRAPLGLSLSPFISYRSGTPFNITTGIDANGDTLFTERPAFVMDLTEPGTIITRFGAFDPTPEIGDPIIPRNFGRGPPVFLANLRIAKEFGFGGGKKDTTKPAGGGNGAAVRAVNSPLVSASNPQPRGDEDESPYKLELSVQIRNLLNHTNRGTPVGNLRSQLFGQSLSLATGGNQAGANRRLQFELVFSF